MASISLKISIVEKDVVKTMQFDPNTAVYDACRVIRDKITEANLGQRKSIETLIFLVSYLFFVFYLFDVFTFSLVQLAAKDYGLFLADEDPKKGIWLEPGRNLGYYVLRTGVRLIIPSINHPIHQTFMSVSLELSGFAGIPPKDEDPQSPHVGRHSQDDVGG